MALLHRLGGLARDTVRGLRGHDLALYAAGVTFYAGIALVPAVLVTVWLTGQLVGQARVAALSRSLADALPSALGAPQVAETAVSAGLRLPLLVAAALAQQASGDELAAAVALLRRRFRTPPANDRERNRALGVLVRKGYENDLAHEAVRALERA